MFPRRRWRSMWRGRIFGCLHPQLQMEQIRSSTVKMRQHRSWKEGRGQTIETSTWLVVPLKQKELTRIVADDDYDVIGYRSLHLLREAIFRFQSQHNKSDAVSPSMIPTLVVRGLYVTVSRQIIATTCRRMPRVSASSRVICHLHLSLPPNPKSIHLPPGESMPRVSSSSRVIPIPIMMWWSSISYA